MTSTAGDVVTTGFVFVVVGGVLLGFLAISLRRTRKRKRRHKREP
jgi:hypothetical protein